MNCCLHRCWPKYSRDYPLTWTSCILSPSWRLNLCSTFANTFSRCGTFKISKLWWVNLVSARRFGICAVGCPMPERSECWLCIPSFPWLYDTPDPSVGDRFTLFGTRPIVGFVFCHHTFLFSMFSFLHQPLWHGFGFLKLDWHGCKRTSKVSWC